MFDGEKLSGYELNVVIGWSQKKKFCTNLAHWGFRIFSTFSGSCETVKLQKHFY